MSGHTQTSIGQEQSMGTNAYDTDMRMRSNDDSAETRNRLFRRLWCGMSAPTSIHGTFMAVWLRTMWQLGLDVAVLFWRIVQFKRTQLVYQSAADVAGFDMNSKGHYKC